MPLNSVSQMKDPCKLQFYFIRQGNIIHISHSTAESIF